MNPKIRLMAVFSACLLGGIAGYAYFFSSKAIIRRAIASSKQSFEKRHMAGFMEIISKNFSDENGFSSADIQEGTGQAFSSFESFKITLENMEITIIDKKTARCTCLATVVATTHEKEKYLVLGTTESGQRIDLDLLKESDGHWRVVRARGYARPS